MGKLLTFLLRKEANPNAHLIGLRDNMCKTALLSLLVNLGLSL